MPYLSSRDVGSRGAKASTGIWHKSAHLHPHDDRRHDRSPSSVSGCVAEAEDMPLCGPWHRRLYRGSVTRARRYGGGDGLHDGHQRRPVGFRMHSQHKENTSMKIHQFARALLVSVIALVTACGAPGTATLPTPPTSTTIPPTPPVSLTPTYSPAPTPTPLSEADKPNDTTQARLRINQCVSDAPPVDVLVNGKVVVSGGMPFTNIAPFSTTGYMYLQPGTFSVAVVPTGGEIAQALLDPVDVPVVAGHRYTLAVMGQPEDADHTSLLIDETEAYQRAGAAPDRGGHLTINNAKGVPGITFTLNGVAGKDAPYGGFAADTWPAENNEGFAFTVSGAPGKVLDRGGPAGYIGPSVDSLACWGGTYPDKLGVQGSAPTSMLDLIAFLEGFHDRGLKWTDGSVVSFGTLLAALRQTGLDKQLTTGSPYLVFAPTDAAFAALPKAERDALLADLSPSRISCMPTSSRAITRPARCPVIRGRATSVARSRICREHRLYSLVPPMLFLSTETPWGPSQTASRRWRTARASLVSRNWYYRPRNNRGRTDVAHHRRDRIVRLPRRSQNRASGSIFVSLHDDPVQYDCSSRGCSTG